MRLCGHASSDHQLLIFSKRGDVRAYLSFCIMFYPCYSRFETSIPSGGASAGNWTDRGLTQFCATPSIHHSLHYPHRMALQKMDTWFSLPPRRHSRRPICCSGGLDLARRSSLVSCGDFRWTVVSKVIRTVTCLLFITLLFSSSSYVSRTPSSLKASTSGATNREKRTTYVPHP